jgi:glycerol-3-phosphate dehydrogenase
MKIGFGTTGSNSGLSTQTLRTRHYLLKKKGLREGVVYHDGQFDDCRLAISLAQTAVDFHAIVISYMKVTGLMKSEEMINGVRAMDEEPVFVYHTLKPFPAGFAMTSA